MNFMDLLKGKVELSDVVKHYVEQATQKTHTTAYSTAQSMPQTNAPQVNLPVEEVQTIGLGFEPIGGVLLEQYVHLLIEMIEVGTDENRCIAIAEQNGFGRDNWLAAKEGWTARMSDPNFGNVRNTFATLYGVALDKKRGGKEPMSLELYVRIFAETSFRKDPADPSRQIDREVALKEHNLTVNEWHEALYYWSPKVSNQHNPVFRKYQTLLDAEITRLQR